jgi:preprotein translocase subunit SecG
MDREDWIELVVAVGSVIVMLAVMIVVGMTYGNGQGVFTSSEGGLVLAGAILFFVFFMTAIGYGLAYFLKDDENGDGNPA